MRAPRLVTLDSIGPDGLASGLDSRGLRWVVRGGVPGAVVEARGRASAGWASAVIEPHPDAIPAPCPAFGSCGGCQWQTLPWARQHEEKLKSLRELLAPLRAEGSLVHADAAYGYRDKLELSFGVRRWLEEADQAAGVDGTGRYLGLHSPNRFDRIVDLDACAIGRPELAAVQRRLREDLLGSELTLWDAAARTGFLRHAILRADDEGVLVLLYTSEPTPEDEAHLRATAATWGASGVLWYVNPTTADAAVGELRAVLHGRQTLEVSFGGRRFHLSPTAFFQVNRPGAEVLRDVVRDYLGTGRQLLDLYCGVGAFALSLTDRFEEVLGVELNPAAVEDAQRNAGDSPVRFLAGEVETVVPALGIARADAVLVDPPRFGLHPKARAWLTSFDAGVLVYVACKPASMVRDFEMLELGGWRCTGWTAVDLFPQTRHVEVAARFVRGP